MQIDRTYVAYDNHYSEVWFALVNNVIYGPFPNFGIATNKITEEQKRGLPSTSNIPAKRHLYLVDNYR